ncbi:MAG TPA: 50S ribosomal protein L7/L12 [Marmoricola sp.]|nr:50S ribosomal protein L7/L12 [Nocardioidaceae bacterium]MCB8993724.1 50S ribosomal protein L7/L12 [Nocardioidaceae bacterium]MCO5324470.1 50S ribosomal protein L7/L12 [Nocardioidaceae bacterium]HMY08003.1 50S ribosomal protein L7/L12 [Marmoricola sp.]HRV69258.1 50S ribosomal protein L7/L12 [Marmoricola sp.]
MAKLSTDELLDAFKEMTLLELSEFVKQFEETFGVTAAAPVAVAAAPGAAAAGGDAGDGGGDQDEFDVILESAGDKKINVIKEVRALTSLGLKEAKELVEAAPKAVLEKVNKEAADKAKESLEGAGATVTLK